MMEYALLFVFLCLLCRILWLYIKYSNPYKLCMVFGAKGSGKTTLLIKKAVQYIRKGVKVYSTVYVPGAELFDVNLVGNYTFPRGSVVFIDEVGMIWDNRDYKKFRTEVRDWFKLQRHYHVKVFLFSQTFDIDLKLRNLTDEMYLCNNFLNFMTTARRIKRWITVVHPSGDAEARICDDIDFVPLWHCIFGAKPLVFTYIPAWVKYFDSFEVPPLPVVPSVRQEVPASVAPFMHRRRRVRFLASVRACSSRLRGALYSVRLFMSFRLYRSRYFSRLRKRRRGRRRRPPT